MCMQAEIFVYTTYTMKDTTQYLHNKIDINNSMMIICLSYMIHHIKILIIT